ncbi:MAG: VOC family protein [Pseudomonadota bacterium]
MTQTKGQVLWLDLTVENPGALKDFYASVFGWTSRDVSMGDYSDYAMLADDGEAVAGVCHKRGPNAGVPPVWMAYVGVASLGRALEAVRAGGGEIIEERRGVNTASMAFIKDPAGTMIAMIEVDQGD